MSDLNTTRDAIRDIVVELAKVDAGFDASKDLYREVGVKSAVGLTLLLTLEERFGVTISDDAFGEATSLDKLAELVSGLAAEAG